MDPPIIKNSPSNQQQLGYNLGVSCFLRRFFFVHLYKHSYRGYKAIQLDEKQMEGAQKGLQAKDIPKITKQQQSIVLASQFQQILQSLLIEHNKTKIDLRDIVYALYKTLKSQILFIIFINVVSIISRVMVTLIFQYLIQSLTEQNYTQAYILAAACCVALFFDTTARHNTFYQSPIFAGKLKSCIVASIFKRILSLTQFTVNKGQIGKTINMISNDFNLIEIKAPFLFGLIVSPLGIIAVTVILVIRLESSGLIAIVIPLFFIPFQLILTFFIGQFIKKINVDKDKRVKMTTQMIDAIKFIKLNGWEMTFKDMILKIRNQQLSNLFKLGFVRSVESTTPRFTIYFGALVALHVYSQSSPLTPSLIFSTLELMGFLRLLNFFIVMGFGFIVECKVFLNRFLQIYNTQSIKMICLQKDDIKSEEAGLQITLRTNQFAVSFQSFQAYWDKDAPLVLKSINLGISYGQFYGLCGPVGSGKSTLLQAMIDQIPYYKGNFQINGQVSYCEQEMIIFSTTIRENILFGRQFEENRYQQIVEVSCLCEDFALFQHGDQTFVGQKGITLSGGQRARVGLARALYKKADIYLFDDPLSAVDTKVAKHIFQNVFIGFLKGKAIVLSTHQVEFLQSCNYVIVMEEGQILNIEKPKSALSQIQKLVKKKQQLDPSESSINNEVERPNMFQNFTEKNEKVTILLFLKYVTYDKVFLFSLVILFFLISEGALTGFMRFLAYYQLQLQGQTTIPTQQLFWGIAYILIMTYLIFCILRYFFLSLSLLYANAKIHEEMLHSLVRSHSYYFDITPLGSLTNKFSNDIGVMDQALIFTIEQTLEGPFMGLAMIANIIEMNPYFIIITIVTLIFLIIVYRYCKILILQSKQLDLKLKTPVFSQLNQVSTGLTQLRIFGNYKEYLKQIHTNIDHSFRANMFYWFNTRIFGVTISFVVFVAVIVCYMSGIQLFQNASFYATALIFVSILLQFLQWFFRNLANAQSMLASVARCFTTISIESQKQLRTEYDKQMNEYHNSYPNQSITCLQPRQYEKQIKFKNYQMKYRSQLPLVLKGVNFEIQKGEKIGIVGRTGAGKSSIIQSLLRICQPQPQSVYTFKGIDALQLGLHTLRHQISIIPQTSHLFKNSIKINVDPFSKAQQSEIWQALQNSNLKQFVEKLPQGLETIVSNNSDVLSVGQKQLLCLARALVRKNNVIILDEATSHVDKKTDRFIQKILREKFNGKTVITIAHRLLTIADYDKIIVMEQGKVRESGSPYELIQKEGAFYEMVMHSAACTEIIQLAGQKNQQTQKINI